MFALVSLVHQPWAYCDESWSPGKAFVVAGYVAPLTIWKHFGERWTESLRDERISEFKMRDCQQAEGEFTGWNEHRRRQVQENFISIITSSGVIGVLSGIELDAYDDLAPKIKPLVHPRVWKPYHLAFQHEIEYVAETMRHLPTYEKVTFVFDRQTEHQANALEQYNSLTLSGERESARLGAITFDDSKRHPGLQAADVLAYEFRRWLMEQVFRNHPDRGKRWQWETLNKGRLIGGYFNRGVLHNYVRALKASQMVVSGNFDAQGLPRSRKPRKLG